MYNLMLDRCWIDGSLPIDPREISKTFRIDLRKVRRILPRLLPNFYEKSGRIHHKRLDKEMMEAIEKSEKNKDAAFKRWHANASLPGSSAIPKSKSELKTEDTTPLTPPPLGDEKPAGQPQQKQPGWTAPTWINPQAWAEFEQHRKEMKQPLTDMARTKAANQLKSLTFESQQQTVDMTIQNRWRGLFPEKRINNHEPRKPKTAVERVEAACAANNTSTSSPGAHGQALDEDDKDIWP